MVLEAQASLTNAGPDSSTAMRADTDDVANFFMVDPQALNPNDVPMTSAHARATSNERNAPKQHRRTQPQDTTAHPPSLKRERLHTRSQAEGSPSASSTPELS